MSAPSRTLLVVQASARVTRSLTRELARAFADAWRARFPADRIVTRDVGRAPPPALDEAHIDAAFARPDTRTREQRAVLALSDELIAEVHRADLLVIATPMYNYGMPAALKAWIDQVVRIGETFTFDLARGDAPLEPVQTGKQLLILSARGEFGFEPGGVREAMNHLDPHLVVATRYLGVVGHRRLSIDYQEFGDERFAASRAAAHAALPALVEDLARRLDPVASDRAERGSQQAIDGVSSSPAPARRRS
jgi:FMN-dependent NADH-azoreductase